MEGPCFGPFSVLVIPQSLKEIVASPANTPRVHHVSETWQTGGFRHVSFATLYLRFRNVVWHFLYKMVAFATYMKRGGHVASPTWHWTRI